MLDVTLYTRPNGRTKVITVTNIYSEDADWFRSHDAKVSMEDIGEQVAIYADVGIKYDEGLNEAIELSRGRTCEETVAALRAQCKRLLKEYESDKGSK